MGVACDEELGTAFDGRDEVLVIVGVFSHDAELPGTRDRVGKQGEGGHPQIDLFRSQCEIPSDFRIPQTAAQFVHNRRGDNELERLIVDEPRQDLTGRSLRADEGADEDVGVEDDP